MQRFSDCTVQAPPREEACAKGAEVPYQILLLQHTSEFRSCVELALATGDLSSCDAHIPVLNALKCYVSIQYLAKCFPHVVSNALYRTEKNRTPV